MPSEVEGVLGDLTHEALRLPEGLVPPPSPGLPNEVHHALAGIQFLRESLWSGQPAVFGLIAHAGRVWAMKSGIEATVEQLTGAPARVRWHEWEGGLPLAWCELGAADVWRISAAAPAGALHAHYRPPLATLDAPGMDDDLTFAPPARPYMAPTSPAGSESRQARRRRHKREAQRLEAALAAWPPLAPTPQPVSPPAPPAAPPAAPPQLFVASPPASPSLPPWLYVAPPPTPVVISPLRPAPEPATEFTPAPEPEPAAAFTPAPEPDPAAAFTPAPEPATEPADTPAPEPVPMPRRAPAPAVRPAPARAVRPAPAPRPTPARPIPVARVAWTARRAWSVAALAAAALAIIGLAVTWGRKPLATLVVGSYTVDVSSAPAGATVSVDGKPIAARTPVTLELAPGEHRVDLEYGEYASATLNVEGQRGDKTARSVAWSGSLGVASADTTVRLAVSFDGQPWGTTPLWKDSVPVGRHRLSFRASGIRSWDEEVQIRSAQSTRVNAEPVHVPPYGLVTARAELVSSTGVEDLDGLPVFVDGEKNGVTPVDLKLDAGPHSVRIPRGDDAPSVHLIDVQAGGRYYATAEFGRPADPLVAFDVPDRISRARPPTLAVRLAADLPLPVRQVLLYVKGQDGTFTRVPAELVVNNGRTVGNVAFPAAALAAPTAKTITYYVEIETREGEEYYSEVRTVPLVP